MVAERERAISWIKMQACSQVVKLNVYPKRKEKKEETKTQQRVRVDFTTFIYPDLMLTYGTKSRRFRGLD